LVDVFSATEELYNDKIQSLGNTANETVTATHARRFKQYELKK